MEAKKADAIEVAGGQVIGGGAKSTATRGDHLRTLHEPVISARTQLGVRTSTAPVCRSTVPPWRPRRDATEGRRSSASVAGLNPHRAPPAVPHEPRYRQRDPCPLEGHRSPAGVPHGRHGGRVDARSGYGRHASVVGATSGTYRRQTALPEPRYRRLWDPIWCPRVTSIAAVPTVRHGVAAVRRGESLFKAKQMSLGSARCEQWLRKKNHSARSCIENAESGRGRHDDRNKCNGCI
jgi:hypothetical protein